jgi:hypothetical protein
MPDKVTALRGTPVLHPTDNKEWAELEQRLRMVIIQEVRLAKDFLFVDIAGLHVRLNELRSDNYKIHEVVLALKETMRELPSMIRDEVHTALHLPPPNDDPPPLA